jgi:hypothetical protein
MYELSTIETRESAFFYAPPPGTRHPEPTTWQERAIKAYNATRHARAATLRAELAHRLKALIGVSPAPDSFHVDLVSKAACVRFDGVLFRLVEDDLFIVRPCAHCGTGSFTGSPLRYLADVGRALSVWQPLHPDCVPDEQLDQVLDT